MRKIKLGQIDYINCLPVYYAIEQNQVQIDAEMVKGPPTKLNQKFIKGELDITPISSIEYARNTDKAFILPQMSISADGSVESILLFSKVPVTELEGLKVSMTNSSATSVTLLKILFEHYYHVQVEYASQNPNLTKMLQKHDAALLIGDDAMLAAVGSPAWKGKPLYITDLGQAWKEFTGQKMIYALWVINQKFVREFPEEVAGISESFVNAKKYGFANVPALVSVAEAKTGLSRPVLENYFRTIWYEFGPEEQKALLTFYDYAYKSGLIGDRVKLNIWGEKIG